jgi:hypothetical protein
MLFCIAILFEYKYGKLALAVGGGGYGFHLKLLGKFVIFERKIEN